MKKAKCDQCKKKIDEVNGRLMACWPSFFLCNECHGSILNTCNQPERSKREDFGFKGTPIIDQLFDDGNLIQRCGALNLMET